jgi:AbrB family looped-hinge helix DNA binding protein
MGSTVIVSSKGQITLPKALREKHRLREGDTVMILETRDGVLIRHGEQSLRGMLNGKIDVKKAEEAIRSLRSEWRL